MEKAGLFPARVKLGKGVVGWLLTEVEEWLKNRDGATFLLGWSVERTKTAFQLLFLILLHSSFFAGELLLGFILYSYKG